MPVTRSAGVGAGVPGKVSVRRVIARQLLDFPVTPGSSRASTKLMLAAGRPASGWSNSLSRRTSMTGLPSSGTVTLAIDVLMNCAEATGTPPPDGGPDGPVGPVGPSGPFFRVSPLQAANASAAQASNGIHRGLYRTGSRAFSNVMNRTPISIVAS